MTTTHLTSLIVTAERRHERTLGSVVGVIPGAARDRKAMRETTPWLSAPVVRELPFRATRSLAR